MRQATDGAARAAEGAQTETATRAMAAADSLAEPHLRRLQEINKTILKLHMKLSCRVLSMFRSRATVQKYNGKVVRYLECAWHGKNVAAWLVHTRY